MPWNGVRLLRLLTRLLAVVLVLFVAAVGVVKSSSSLESRRAKTETAGSQAAAVDLAAAQAFSTAGRERGVAPSARSFALIVGNSGYPDDETPAQQAVDDARAMTDEMRTHGFDVSLGEDLTKQAMLNAFSNFASKIEPGAIALIFFSGYGIQSEGRTYLIPVNAEIWRETDVARDGVALDTWLAELDARGAAIKLVVVDARRNPFEWRFRGASAGLAPIKAPKGTLLIYSAAPGQVIHDDDASLFMGELINQMRRDGASVEDAFNRTRMMVARASHDELVPGVFSSLTNDVSLPASSIAVGRESPQDVRE
jgi:uncharacterized caspase-like protein